MAVYLPQFPFGETTGWKRHHLRPPQLGQGDQKAALYQSVPTNDAGAVGAAYINDCRALSRRGAMMAIS